MTCGIGYADGKSVWIASDRCASDSYSNQSIISIPKVFQIQNAPIILSFCGGFKIYDLLKYRLTIPEKVIEKGLKDKKNIDKFVRTELIDFIGNIIKNNNLELCTGKTDELDFSLLLGVAGKIYLMEEDLAVTQYENNLISIGTGEEVATGAFTAFFENEKNITNILFKTLKITSEKKVNVKPPFDIFTLVDNKVSIKTFNEKGKQIK